MDGLRHKVLYTAAGALTGLAGLVSSRCAGGTCTSCFGCGGIGVGILLMVLFNKIKGDKKRTNGMT